MKKISGIIILFLIVFLPAHLLANVVHFGIDDTIDFSQLEGFDLYINQPDGPPNDLSAVFYKQEDTFNLDGTTFNGAIPYLASDFPWDTDISSYGAFGFNMGGADTYPLGDGLICSLTSQYNIAITEISLTGPSGDFPHSFNVLENKIGEDVLYTVSSVPIPPALLLLGSGLVGMISFRRKLLS